MRRIVLLVITLLAFATAKAQVNTTASQVLNLVLTNSVEIVFVGTGTSTGSSLSLPFTSVTNYASGVESTVQQLKVRSNKNFKVSVKSNATNFTYTGTTTPSPTMVVASVLNLKVTANSTGGTIANSFSSYQDIPTTNIDILSNCTRGGNQLFSIQYWADPQFNYPAGNYAVDVVFTATQL